MTEYIVVLTDSYYDEPKHAFGPFKGRRDANDWIMTKLPDLNIPYNLVYTLPIGCP